ncbi:hypothetical protein FRC10_002717 [Ceratobasidium sp. 414]|nr:hypothetical protein FRC10_002717 [Ceratobasidium sp. 414]
MATVSSRDPVRTTTRSAILSTTRSAAILSTTRSAVIPPTTQSAVIQSTIQSPIQSTAQSTTSRRPRASTTRTSTTPTFTPYDASSDQRADNQRTNRILIGVFSSIGALFLAFIAFYLFRCYKRRKERNSVPLPPPRKSSMSQLGYRNSRIVSMYGEYPTPDFSRPPSVFARKDHSFGSHSALAATPSVHSNAASTEVLAADETGKKSTELLPQPGHATQESTSDNSFSGPPMAPNSEEGGRRLSPLGSRSQSPSNVSPPRPASQAQVYTRPESRSRNPRPNSVASASRHSFLNTGSWQHGPQRHSSYGNRNSYYAAGNYGAPHSPHARERVGLVMPQPLAPELFDYALSGRHDMGLDFTQGPSGSQGSLARGSSDQPLAPPRTDLWVGRATPLPPLKDGSLPHGRSSHSDIPRP